MAETAIGQGRKEYRKGRCQYRHNQACVFINSYSGGGGDDGDDEGGDDFTQLSIPTHAQLQRHRLKFIKNHLKNSYMFRSSTIFRELQCPR